ncbi:MAG: hypothetical protein K6F55_04565 [Eubacterium sp.]|nr:hypothetical protein [Eubacterium sp.]
MKEFSDVGSIPTCSKKKDRQVFFSWWESNSKAEGEAREEMPVASPGRSRPERRQSRRRDSHLLQEKRPSGLFFVVGIEQQGLFLFWSRWNCGIINRMANLIIREGLSSRYKLSKREMNKWRRNDLLAFY